EQLDSFTVGQFIVAFLSEPIKGNAAYGGGWILPQVQNLRTANNCSRNKKIVAELKELDYVRQTIQDYLDKSITKDKKQQL
ncbi:MAG: hypothetical protein VZR27_11315, partial [Acutalibacteraceae bacterium]|nr:hypothetical protein [Acutalibacteraceae bacterium]